MKTEKYICDIDSCSNEAKHIEKTIQVIFTTNQTDGSSTSPYLSIVEIDLCDICLAKILEGNMLHGTGAQGHNIYKFKNK